MRLGFTDPCKNHIKPIQKTSVDVFHFFDSFYQITVKSKQICNTNTHLRNAVSNAILSRPYEKSMMYGINLFAKAFPKPSDDQLRPEMQHANVPALKRGSLPRSVPACLTMFLPAPKL